MKKHKTKKLKKVNRDVSPKVSDLKSKLDKHIAETELLFKIVFKRLGHIEKMIDPELNPLRRNMWIQESTKDKQDQIWFQHTYQ